MSEYGEHFIREIEIKNYKLFKDFSAKGFGRVNLIGGKNNVGKTAFMEACYLSQSESTENLFSKLFEIETHRDLINLVVAEKNQTNFLKTIIKSYSGLNIGDVIQLYLDDNNKIIIHTLENEYEVDVDKYGVTTGYQIPKEFYFDEVLRILSFELENISIVFSKNFISPYSNSNNEIEKIIGDSKLNRKYKELNNYLKKLFNLGEIDIIKNIPMINTNNEWRKLSEFGQGLKSFINIVGSILLLENNIIFIDEIENGIHYTNLDKLWEIILKISKEQNVQVFATTHSKECIESYARMAKKLEDDEIGFIELGRNKKDELDSIVMNSEMFQRFIKLGNEVRGW